MFFGYILALGAGRRAALFSRRAFLGASFAWVSFVFRGFLVTFWPWVLGVVLLFFFSAGFFGYFLVLGAGRRAALFSRRAFFGAFLDAWVSFVFLCFLVTFWPWVLGVMLLFFLGGLFWVLFLLGVLLFFGVFWLLFGPGCWASCCSLFSRRASRLFFSNGT